MDFDHALTGLLAACIPLAGALTVFLRSHAGIRTELKACERRHRASMRRCAQLETRCARLEGRKVPK
jgi:hypothetical protein